MSYNIFQIKISKEVSDYVNSNDLGHTGGERKYPIYEAHMRLRHSFGDKIQFKNTDFQHYTKVCEVKKDAGLVCDGDSWMLRDLEDVFAVLNGRYYDEDTSTDIVHEAHVSGYKMKTITRKDGEVVTYRDMHSLSVGDIVEDVDNGTFHIVAGFGFEDITSNILKEVA
tara:strand:- start:322 stop:825 length:504 start_codon:yes stop_codon:yes gene_type:complete